MLERSWDGRVVSCLGRAPAESPWPPLWTHHYLPHKYKTVNTKQWTHSWCNTHKWKHSLIGICLEHTPTQHSSENTVDKTHTEAEKPSISLESFVLIWIETLESLQCTSCKQNWSNYFHENMKTIVFMKRANIWVVILVSSMICAKQNTFVIAAVPGSTKCSQALNQTEREESNRWLIPVEMFLWKCP